MVATRGGSSLLSVDLSGGQRCNGKIVAEKGGISVGVESQVTECHAIKEGRRTTPRRRRRLEMNDWNGEEDERSERLMDGSSWHLIVIRRRHSLANHAAISGPGTAFCVFARDFTVSFVAKGHDSLEGELTGSSKLKDSQAGTQGACPVRECAE